MSCSRPAYAKSVMDYHQGLLEPSCYCKLPRIPCRHAALRTIVFLGITLAYSLMVSDWATVYQNNAAGKGMETAVE